MKLILVSATFVLSLATVGCGSSHEAPAPAARESVAGAVTPREASSPASAPAAPAPPPVVAPSASASVVAPPSVPASAPSSAPSPAEKSRSGLEVRRLVLASHIVAREPEPLLEPRANEPLLAFVEAKNGASSEERLIVSFEHESGTKVGFIELTVPAEAPRYRTWARTHNIRQPGNWVAVVRSEAGEELGRTEFRVTEG